VRRAGVLKPAALAVAFAAAAVGLGRAAHGARSPEARAAEGLPPLGLVNVLAVDLLWLRADGLFAANRWPEMTAAYEMAGRVEPRLAAAFEYRGFHLAYNLAGNAASDGDRDRWVIAGLEVFDEGLARNPGSTDLRGWLGHALYERTKRWPSLVPKLKAKRGREPWDEAVDVLDAAVKAEPGYGLNVLRLADVLEARGRKSMPSPPAAKDFRRAAEALRALAPLVPADARLALDAMVKDLESLERNAGK
jgi:hypothetical protein